MDHAEQVFLEHIHHTVTERRLHALESENKAHMLAPLAKALSLTPYGSRVHQDLIGAIMELAPDAGRIAPAATIDALSKSVLWAGNEYIPHFAQLILILEKPALAMNPDQALAALEQSLTVCYSVILPRNLHGTGRCNNVCIEWQRYTFLSVIQAIEDGPPAGREALEGILKISRIMTGISHELNDLNQRIQYLAYSRNLATALH